MVLTYEGISRAWSAVGYDGYVVKLNRFPRRGKTVLVTFAGGDEVPCDPLDPLPRGRLVVPNPTPGPFPDWHSSPLPQTQQSGSVAFTLTSLTRAHYDHEVRRIVATFQVTDDGKPTRNWIPFAVTVRDATGQLSAASGNVVPTSLGWKSRSRTVCRITNRVINIAWSSAHALLLLRPRLPFLRLPMQVRTTLKEAPPSSV